MAYRNPFEDDNDNEGFEEISSAEIARLQQEKRLYQERMIQSSSRSQRIIEETKQVAVKTEEELARQEESLLRTEANLDKIHSDIKIADRHLTSLKSIWGTVGNLFRKNPQPSKPLTTKPTGLSSQKAVDEEPSQIYAEDAYAAQGAEHPSSSNQYDAIVDKNLDGMMAGLSELKAHAMLMGDTLDRHDELLGRVIDKAAAADKKIEDTDRKTRKILR